MRSTASASGASRDGSSAIWPSRARIIRSVFQTTAPGTITEQLLSGSADGRELMKFAIVGLPVRSEGVSQLTRIQEIRPTFLLVWIGNNDVLPMATRTDPGSVTMTAAEFGQRYRQLLNALADTGTGGMAVANLPDVTALAALRPARTDVTTCRAEDGSVSAVAPDDLIAIDLSRDRLPEPPCGRVLDAAEQAAVRATVMRFNDEIASAVADVEASRGVPIALVDVFALFDRLRGGGVDGVTSRYLGGVFSLDGIHPTRTGQALIANAFIDALDARFGESIPEVNVARVAARDPFVGNRFRPVDEPPFGVVASEDVDELFDGAFRRIERDRRRLARDLVRRGRGLFDDLKDLVGL